MHGNRKMAFKLAIGSGYCSNSNHACIITICRRSLDAPFQFFSLIIEAETMQIVTAAKTSI